MALSNDAQVSTAAGFKLVDDQLQVIQPSCIRSASPGLHQCSVWQDTVTLFRLLRRYHLEQRGEQSTSAEERGQMAPVVSEGSDRLHWIECVIELIEDFKELGLLRFDRHVTGRHLRGRIDWRSTVRREYAVHSEDHLLYLQPRYRALVAAQDHPLTQLHAHTIRHIAGTFGTESVVEVPETGLQPISPRWAKRVLLQHRNQLYRDRDIRVLAFMTKYWMDQDLNRASGRVSDLLWAERFEFLWERMLKKVLAPRPITGFQMPRGRYSEDGMESPGLQLRPDIAVDVGDSERIIYDAKYYSGTSLPATGDVLKQMAYAHYAAGRWSPNPSRHVYSVFLLPADSPNRPIRLSGVHRLDTIDGDGPVHAMHDPVWLFRVDYRALANAYLAGDYWDSKQVLSQIRKAEN